MKLVLLKDPLIKQKQLDQVLADFTDIYKTYAGITPQFFIEERDYSSYPVELDSDGDGRLPPTYISAATSDIHKRYSGEGTDHVVFLIHKTNWRLPGLWGTNYSNTYNGYQVQICRYDHENTANSLGTLYHEVMHSHDALIYTMLGFNVNTLFKNVTCYQDWDNTVVHGNRFRGCATPYTYIRWRENTDALSMIGPKLREAYAKRQAIYDKKVSAMQSIVSLSQRFIVLAREVLRRRVKYK